MDRLLRDLQFALRLLWKDKSFTLTAVATLAVCIALNVAIFTIVNAVILRPLPFPEPDRLVWFNNSYPNAGVERASNGVPDYFDRRKDMDVLAELALYGQRGQTIGGKGDVERVTGMQATPSLLRMLHVTPARGRIFTEDEGELGSNHKVLLTWKTWQQRFGGRENVVGSDLRVNGEPYAIVGVLPEDFRFLSADISLWTPLAFTAEQKSDERRHSNNFQMIGRLKPGASIEQAQAQLNAINARNLDILPALKQALIDAGFHSVVTPLQEDLVRDVRPTLNLLWGGVLFVLLIGCVNVTNLLLARSSKRVKEFATRHALGAGRWLLARQVVTETVLMTSVGGVLGLGLAAASLRSLAALQLDRLPRSQEIGMDATVVLFTIGLALAVGLLVGLVPAIGLHRTNLTQAFREEGRTGSSGRAARLLRQTLVTSEVALALMLLIGAGLLLASFRRVLAVDPGFKVDHVLTGRVTLPQTRYAKDPELLTFSDRLLDRLRALPGVSAAAITDSIPFEGDFSDSVIMAEGYTPGPGESVISPNNLSVSSGFFETMGIPIVRGRAFLPSDTAESPKVVIVDERLAKRFWRDADPVGRRMFQPSTAADGLKPGPNTRWLTVVGVVRSVRLQGLAAGGPEERLGAYYFPLPQSPLRGLGIVLRTNTAPEGLTSAVRAEVAGLDPELPFYAVRTLSEWMDTSLADRRTPMALSLAFGAAALFLAAIGIYGVLAYQVTQRTREIGIRMALGGAASNVFALVLREGAVIVGVGFAIGLAGAFLLRSVIASQLYEVQAMDPMVIIGVTAVLACAALAACLAPARRASRIDPVVALAHE